MEKWLEVGVGKEGSLEEKNLERSSKAREGGRWDMSAKDKWSSVCTLQWGLDHVLIPIWYST